MFFKKPLMTLLSSIGALGNAFQNAIALITFVKTLMSQSFAISKIGLAISQGLGWTLGGLCSAIINFSINIELLESFFQRFKDSKAKNLKGYKKFQYWFGACVFVLTGILFGLTSFAISASGALFVLSMLAGIAVSIIMTIQELETWLSSFDESEESTQSFYALFIQWKNSLTKGKCIGIIISLGNVIALSLLFTIGLATFASTIGLPMYPAIITSFVIAFTGGAFTEFYFYNTFLSTFCDKFKEKWSLLIEGRLPYLGLGIASINAAVNGVLSYVGIMMLGSLLAAAGIGIPPLGIMMGGAIIVSLMATTASFILGLDFWVRNNSKLSLTPEKEKIDTISDTTQQILGKLEVGSDGIKSQYSNDLKNVKNNASQNKLHLFTSYHDKSKLIPEESRLLTTNKTYAMVP